ncbi:MAG: HpcH/HpaI aldolase/citrate lyase family protein [Geminicoccaceae bacterium]
MRNNHLCEMWRDGGAAVNGWLSIPSSFAAEVMAHQGWDSLTIDMQHGVADYQQAVTMLQAISTTDTVPLCRVPWLEPGIIMRMLDAGAYGIICPMVNTAEDARAFVSYCRYPPDGTRSFGPIRATLYAGADYPENANATVITMAMIETAEALSNLDEILAVPGLDAVYVGPSDLANSLGHPPQMDPSEPAVVEAIERICKKATDKGIVAGLHNGTPDYAASMISKGFRFVTIGSDSRLMATKAKEVLGVVRSGRAGVADTSGY